LAELPLIPEHRRVHGASYDAINHGRIEIDRLRTTLAGLPLPRAANGRIALAVDVLHWLRPDAACSPERLFCYTYTRGKGQAQMIPGWPYSFVAALETGRTSWTALLDAVRLRPADDATASTAAQLRDVVGRILDTGHWQQGDPSILIVADAGYDVTRLAFVLADPPVEVVGRIRSDRVMLRPAPPRAPGATGRPRKHGGVFALAKPNSWHAPEHTTHSDTTPLRARPSPGVGPAARDGRIPSWVVEGCSSLDVSAATGPPRTSAWTTHGRPMACVPVIPGPPRFATPAPVRVTWCRNLSTSCPGAGTRASSVTQC
jgi:hypothetical protein